LRGTAIELEAVLAVVVGGALLTGGRGSIIGAALGVIMVSMIKQGLILMGIPAFWFKAGIGVVLILAAYINHRVQQASLK
jgi:simple sugar transport system permease protein